MPHSIRVQLRFICHKLDISLTELENLTAVCVHVSFSPPPASFSSLVTLKPGLFLCQELLGVINIVVVRVLHAVTTSCHGSYFCLCLCISLSFCVCDKCLLQRYVVRYVLYHAVGSVHVTRCPSATLYVEGHLHSLSVLLW